MEMLASLNYLEMAENLSCIETSADGKHIPMWTHRGARALTSIQSLREANLSWTQQGGYGTIQ